ncbi:hypothetical protein [Humidesulfovibrio idahonensis]
MLRLKLLLLLLGFVLFVMCDPAEGRHPCAACAARTDVSAPPLCPR